jgi:hypothetical protein
LTACSKQQSRRRYAANGFAFVPQYVPLDGIVGLSKLGSELVVHLRPILPLKEGRPQSDQGRIAPKRSRSSDLCRFLANINAEAVVMMVMMMMVMMVVVTMQVTRWDNAVIAVMVVVMVVVMVILRDLFAALRL